MLHQLGMHAITYGYVVFNGLRVIAYVPQIRKLCVNEDASGVSAVSWMMFAGAHGSTALYAFGIQHDLMLALLTSVNFVCSMAIASLAFHRQKLASARSRPIRVRPIRIDSDSCRVGHSIGATSLATARASRGGDRSVLPRYRDKRL